MRCVALIGDLITHPRQQLECSPVAKFGIEFAFEYVEDVPQIAPVISQVAGGVFHLRTRRSPIVNVRQMASPVSPGCTVGATPDQSVTVNGSGGIFILNVPERIEWLGDHLQQVGNRVPVALDGGEVVSQGTPVDATQMPAA